ncbi:MAG: hypothetical protein H5U40_09510, partial [Polyangiaceae bacterium]|nr:hypothetical protein [Polyangiaceae bacterium]
AALLEPDPALRSGSLDALLSALARQADAPVPIVDIGPYHDARARSARPLPGEPTDPTADVIRTTSMPPPDDVTMPRIDLRGTPYSFDRPESGPPPADSRDLTRRVSYPPRPEAGERDGAREEQGADELVTRPSQDRRWLGRVIEGAAAGGTQEISLDQIVEENAPAPYDEPFPAAPASLDELPSPDEFDDDALTIVSGADLIEDAPIPKNGTYNSLTLEGLKPIPRPKRLESILPPPTTNPSGENYVLFDDSGHFDASVSEALRIPPPPLQIEPSVTTLRPPRSTKRTGTARKVLVGSLLTALAIVASSLVFATYERVEAERQREQRLEERFRELTTRNAGEP